MTSKLNSNAPHRLEDEDSRLYSPNSVGHKEKRFDTLFPKKFSVNKDWDPVQKGIDGTKKAISHPTFFKKFFIFSLIFALFAIGASVFTFLTGGNTVSNDNITLTIGGNSFTPGGDELPLQISIENKNPTDLELADLFVAYDKGGDSSKSSQHVNDLNAIGTISAGKTAKKNVYVTLYGGEGTTQNIDFTLQYRIHGSNAIFVKKTSFPVTISSAPIALSLDIPKNVTPNQNISFVVHVQSNSKAIIPDALLHVDYPNGFNFISADPAPKALNNVWDLGSLNPGDKHDVTITGTVYGQDGEDRAFHVSIGSPSAGDTTAIGLTYNSLAQIVSLVKPFVSATLAINGSSADTVSVPSNSTVNVKVNWANNLTNLITDAKIVVTLSGNALDPVKVFSTKGFYDSIKKTITWDRTNDTDLASIQPSDTGSEDFSFDVPPLISPKGVLTNPTVNMSVSIAGKQPDIGGVVSQVTDSETKKAVVSSDLGFSVGAFYKSGVFTNTGPIPPKANTPTTYTITWTITNSANTLSDAVASATLPTYVDWMSSYYPTNDGLSYDDTTRLVTWKMGQVVSGTGFSGNPRTVSFQVRLNPSTSQIGSVPKLILDTSVSAQDTFTGETLSATKPALNTRLQNDLNFPYDGEKVVN
ncbi:MAG: hypothetical protein WCO65_01220 [bacterium]